MRRVLLFFVLVFILSVTASANSQKKKDITSYNDIDLERLFEEWEENDEDQLEEDELPAHKQKPKKIDLDSMKAQAKSPEDLLRMSKRGQTIMTFVNIRDPANPTKKDIRPLTEKWTSQWQSMLYNNHVDVQVFVIEDDRAIFMFKEGSQAFEGKDFLVKQPQVTEVSLEGQIFPGAGAAKSKQEL